MSKRITSLVLALTVAGAGVALALPEAADPLTLYGTMHAAMANDSADGVAAAAAELAGQVRAAAASAKDPAAYAALAAAAEKMHGSDLAALREQFKELSKAFAGYVRAGGAAQAQLYYCPMADAYWLQQSADAGVRNPYYGKSMLKCGAKAEKVEG